MTDKTAKPFSDDLHGAGILLVDDEQPIHDIVQGILIDSGVDLCCVKTIEQAKKASLKKCFDVALVDMVLPNEDGMDLVNHLKELSPSTTIIVITGYADRDMAWELESASVRSVLVKPFSAAQLRFTVCKELARKKLLDKEGAVEIIAPDCADLGLTGNSAYIKNLRKKISIFSQGNMPVLIHGPTGTGKEIIAAAIHDSSARKDCKMIIVNSSAIPEHLEESEFFGHCRGAFTGAEHDKEGLIACAENSSLFLDEVGELSLRMQAKLLRVLDGHEYSRIGETKTRKCSFRLISATNRDLTAMISEGSFRKDLYFRLNAGVIVTDILANHSEDIPLLVRRFIYDYNMINNKKILITKEALDRLTVYNWPGNIRELKNIVHSLCVVNNASHSITKESIEWIMADKQNASTGVQPFTDAKKIFEDKFYRTLLAKHNGNITACASEAKLDRPNFSKKLKALGIDAEEYKKKN